MFFNISNHPSERWSQKQLNAAVSETQDSKIQDLQFPQVSPAATKEDIRLMAEKMAENVPSGSVAMVAGEATLVFALVGMLKEKGVRVVSACTQRISSEETTPDGKTVKVSQFEFVGFREF